MIKASGLTKRYGSRLAVDDADFTVEAGKVTGFLGPNGAGKSTTMRMILGLDRPTRGGVTVNGVRYDRLAAPLCEVGALLDAKALHGGRTAYNHLKVLAKTNGLPKRRVDEVIGLVGLQSVAGQRAKGFSLGMGQRLGIAAALLGDPKVLMFDEPVNGLDPEGILWIRTLMKALAAEGRAVFVSSHLMSEMALTADHLLVIGRGRILADQPMADFIAANSVSYVRVRTARATELAALLGARGWRVEQQPDKALRVHGASPQEVGETAGVNGVWLHELTLVQSSLEEAFMRLTADSVEYHAATPAEGTRAPGSPAHAARAGTLTGAAAPGSSAAPTTAGWPHPVGATVTPPQTPGANQ